MGILRGVKSTTVQPCCAPLLSAPLDADAAGELAAAFKALADPVRLQLLSLIAAVPDGACSCDLEEPVGKSQPTVSHHLKILRQAGLVSGERRGTWIWYSAVPERLAELRRAFDLEAVLAGA